MRISFVVAAADLTGGARVIHTYAELLARRGHDVHVISRPSPRPALRRQVKNLLLTGRRAVTPPQATHYRDGAYRLHVIDNHRPIAAEDVSDSDVVIATWWETAEWVWNMPSSKGRKIHFVQHYEAHEGMPKARVDAVLRLPTVKITISDWLEALLKEEFGNSRVEVVKNSVDTTLFYAPRRLRQSQPTIGMLYHLNPWKNCQAGFAAVEVLRRRLPETRLMTFGAAPDNRLPLPTGTTHQTRPAQGKIRDIYAACDVWLCPSKGEGFHLPPLEAMACRTPVVSTKVGGPIDTIVEGWNGYLSPSDEPEVLAGLLENVLKQSEEDWLAMSDASYETAHRYSWEDATDLFEAALFRAVEAPKQAEALIV